MRGSDGQTLGHFAAKGIIKTLFYSWGDSQSGNFHAKNDRALSKASCSLGLNYIIQVNFLGRRRFLPYLQGKNFPRAYYVTEIYEEQRKRPAKHNLGLIFPQ